MQRKKTYVTMTLLVPNFTYMSWETLTLDNPISVKKKALSGDMITLIVSNDAQQALKNRWLELWAEYEIWKNKWWEKPEAVVKIEGLSGGPLGTQDGVDGTWVESRIREWGSNVSLWTSENGWKIGNMWYLNDFKIDSRGGSITTINWTEFYFDKVERSSVWDQVSEIISK